ncbi:MAG: tetratricopeptide repeat protein [Candidatus Zixiibacteriota bacterium]
MTPTPSKMLNRLKDNKWPLTIAAIAVLVRLIYLLEISNLPEFLVPMVDEKWHWEWAQQILSESFWGQGAYFRAPLYPYFLALLALVTGSSILFAKILQILLTAGTAWFIFQLARQLFDSKTAIVAGLIYAFYGTLVFYETMFLIPALFLLLIVWAMFRTVAYRQSSSIKTWLMTGIVFGLAALARPNVLIVIPFLMLWLFFSGVKKASLTIRIKLPTVLLVGLIITIAPVTIRNLIVTGDFILISSQGGINLYLGNNPEADGLTMLMPEVDLNEAVSWRQFGVATQNAAEREAGRRLSEAEQSSFWSKKAVSFIVNNPAKFADLLWRKTVYLLSGFENSDNLDIYHQRTKSALYSILVWKKILMFPFGILLPLTLAGVYLTKEKFKNLIPVYIFLLAYIPSIILFLVTARHRLPLIPFMIIIAAGGLVYLFGSLREMKSKQYMVAGALLLIPLFVFNRTHYEEVGTSDFQIYFNEGIQFEQLGDYARAEQSYRMADRDYPYSATLVNSLGHIQFLQGNYGEAAQNYLRAIQLDPNFSPAYNNLGLLVRQVANPDTAVALFRNAIATHGDPGINPERLALYYANLADTYSQLRLTDSAEYYYRKSILTAPSQAVGYFRYGSHGIRNGQLNMADSLFTVGRTLGEPTPAELFNWGLSYLRRQEFNRSLELMRVVVNRDSTFYQAYHCIGVIYYNSGFPVDSALEYVNRALALNPSYQPSLDLRNTLNRGN